MLRRRGALVAVLALVVAPACGASDPPPTQVLAAAREELVDQSLRVSVDGRAEAMGAPGQALTISGGGVVDYGRQRSRLRLEQGDGDDRIVQEIVFNQDEIYVRTAPGGGGDTSWVRLDASEGDPAQGLLGLLDPFSALDSLDDQDAKVVAVGDAKVRGTSTFRYRVTPSRNDSSSSGHEPFDVWIDNDDRLRRVAMEGETRSPSEGAPSYRLALTVDIVDYGVDDEITVPSSGDITDLRVGTPLEGIEPVGDWSVLGSGDSQGVRWTVWTVDGGEGVRCTSVETVPDLGGVALQKAPDGSGKSSGSRSDALAHRGRRANCVPDPAEEPTDIMAFSDPLQVVDADALKQTGAEPHYVAALASPEASNVVALYSDGAIEPVTVTNGLIFLAWTSDRELEHFELTLGAEGDAQRWRCGGSNDSGILRGLGGSSCYTEHIQTK